MFNEASVCHDVSAFLHKTQGRFREPASARGEFVSAELHVHQFERIQHPARTVAIL